MPTYEYTCKDCGEHLEVVQSFRDEPLQECPQCGGKLRKVFGNIGIAFKGSGFYKTDNRSGGKSHKTEKSEKSETKSEPKSETKSETKSSDTKPDSGSKKSEAKSA
jgi:putative FmdB family regulatory protein